MNFRKKTFRELRKDQYSYNLNLFPYLNSWIKNPYSFIKARFYMESSAILVYLLLKTTIKPNTVTIFYCLAGVFTGILLAIPNDYTILIALLIAFTKGILDWSDGQLARVKGETSLTGSILDGYGAILNSLGLQIGLGLYVASRLEIVGIYYLVALLLFFRSSSLFIYSKSFLFSEISNKNIISNYLSNKLNKKDNKNEKETLSPTLSSKISNFFRNILDDRARSVDFICFIIILEFYYPINISLILFSIIVVKYFFIFIISFYKVSKIGWSENKLLNKIKEIDFLLEEEDS
jgi:hypothetical protein